MTRRPAGWYRTPPSEPLAFLAAVSQGDPGARGTATPELVDLAIHHRLASALRIALRDEEGLPEDLVAALAARHREAVEQHLRACADLQVLAAVLARAEVSWAAVKGPVLAELAYRRPDLRSYLDLDVLVAPEHLGAALEALASAGVHPGVALDALTDARWGEVPLALWHGSTLDLHWHLLARPEQRRSLRWSTAELLGRIEVQAVGAGPVPVLDPVDQLLHVSAHACLSGGDRLRWWADTAALVDRHDLDWTAFEARARAAGVAPMAAIMLDRARWWLGRGAPEAVIERLGGRTRWAQRANATACRSLGPDRPRVSGRLVTGATRGRLTASIREAGRLLVVRRIFPARSTAPTSSVRTDAPGAIDRYVAMATFEASLDVPQAVR